MGGYLDKEFMIFNHLRLDIFPVLITPYFEIERNYFGREKSFGEHTSDEWRSYFTAFLVGSMTCGIFRTLAFKDQEVFRCVQF